MTKSGVSGARSSKSGKAPQKTAQSSADTSASTAGKKPNNKDKGNDSSYLKQRENKRGAQSSTPAQKRKSVSVPLRSPDESPIPSKRIRQTNTTIEDEEDSENEQVEDLTTTPQKQRERTLRNRRTPDNESPSALHHDDDAEEDLLHESAKEDAALPSDTPQQIKKKRRTSNIALLKSSRLSSSSSYSATHSHRKSKKEQEYALSLSREAPNDEELEKHEEHIKCLPGVQFPVRASRIKTVETALRSSLASSDEEAQEIRSDEQSAKELQEKLKVVRVMVNIAFMRYPFMNPRNPIECHTMLLRVFENNFLFSDYELFQLIRNFWGTQLRQHLRVQRRTELSQNGKDNLWQDLNIEFRPYFKNMHVYFTHEEGNEEQGTAAVATATEESSTGFVIPRGLKYCETGNDMFESYVESMWLRCTGSIFSFTDDKDFADFIHSEEIGLRRSFFKDAVPNPWWKGLVEWSTEEEDMSSTFTYQDVLRQVQALVNEQVAVQIGKNPVGDKTIMEEPLWIWHPLFLLEHFLNKGGGKGKEYFQLNDSIFGHWQDDIPLPERRRHKAFEHSSFVDQISDQIEAMALLYLQLFTWKHCRHVVKKGIQSIANRDIKENDDSVGFDMTTPNFGWFLYAKDIVKRYLILTKYDRKQTVQPLDDDYKKIPRRIDLPPGDVRKLSVEQIQQEPDMKKYLTPPTQYYRWFLYAARVCLGRSTADVPEYLKKWQSVMAEESRQDSDEGEANDGSGTNRRGRKGESSANAYASLGLDPSEKDSLF